ncbi:MAG: dTMP kinase, partial [Phycisphaerales bacterium]|nr:dTMP kinase [Phycisphaerales bacterium]
PVSAAADGLGRTSVSQVGTTGGRGMGGGGGGPDPSWVRAYAGRFIVFEGPDGSGKSTQLKNLADLVKGQGVRLTEVREPGGTPVGERIREHIVLAKAAEGLDMSVRCEMLLYMASRAELVERRILPALKAGELVLADRYVASTLAYQGAAGGLPVSDIAAAARVATRNLLPDLYVVFDIDEVAAAKRLSPLLDRMEAKGAEFHRRVRQGYLEQARQDPGRYAVVDASLSQEQVWAQVQRELAARAAYLVPR